MKKSAKQRKVEQLMEIGLRVDEELLVAERQKLIDEVKSGVTAGK